MTSGRWLVVVAGLGVLACSSKARDSSSAPSERPIGSGCDPATECDACGSCFDECLCGGGTTARCALACHAPPEAPEDAGGASSPQDGGTPAVGSLVATVVPQAFDIPPGAEYFRCQDFANPFGRDVAVLETESFMTSGSHHLFVFEKPNATDGELEECSGLEFTSNLHLAQRSQERFLYPPGVGRFLPGTEGLRVQIHFLNTSNEPVHTQIAVTVRAAPPEDVPVHASQIFMNTLSIYVPPHSTGTAQHQCPIPKDVNVFCAGSHMHQHGVHFVARVDDGQLLYETTQWAEPEPWTFSPPRKLKAGSAIQVQCDYDNRTDQPLGFGESAATNEMCIFTGTYYPALDGESIVCLF